MTTAAPDRRPIRARSSPLWIAVAHKLAARGVSPNAISIVGMLACLLAGAAIIASPRVPAPWPRILLASAALLIFIRLLANMLDGMVAIRSGRASPVGELFNEVPDRVSDVAVIAALGHLPNSNPELAWAAALVAVFTAYIRAAAKVAGAPQDYRGPMAKPHRMALTIAALAYLALTPAAWQPDPAVHGWSIPFAALWIIILGGLLTAARRLERASTILRTPSP